MATNDQPTIDLGSLIRGFVQDLRLVARPPQDRGGEEPNQGIQQLRQATEHVRGMQAEARVQVNETYRGRTEAMQTVLNDRQNRLEAYAERQRQAVPSSPDRFIVAGRVTDRESGAGLPHVRVRATDLDRRADDVLGHVRTDALGYYRIEYTAAEIDERDQVPETYIEVLDDAGEVVYTSAKSFVQKTGAAAFITAEVEGERLPNNRRMAQKVSATVERRHEEFAKRQRVLSHRPELKLSGGRAMTVPASVAPRGPVPATPTKDAPERALTEVKGVGPVFRERLDKEGVKNVEGLAKLKPARVAKILNISESRAKAIVTDAKGAARRK